MLINYIIADTLSNSTSLQISKFSFFIEGNDEIKEYDRIIKESIKEDYFDEQEEKFEYDFFYDSNILNETTNLYENNSENLNSFNVYFYYKINEKNENNFLIESDDLNIENQCVSDLIYNIVKKINSKKIIINFENNEFILSLKEYENIELYNNNYELRLYDKISHIPNYDNPCFSPELLLDELIAEDICFVVKKSNNIKLLEKFDNEQKVSLKASYLMQ